MSTIGIVTEEARDMGDLALDNPFGHSGRRISDFWAGLNRDFSRTQDWKRFRTTPHDHNPVNDALGNAEALTEILRLAGNWSWS